MSKEGSVSPGQTQAYVANVHSSILHHIFGTAGYRLGGGGAVPQPGGPGSSISAPPPRW